MEKFVNRIGVPLRAVEPDFEKSNKKSDAQGACIRLLHSK